MGTTGNPGGTMFAIPFVIGGFMLLPFILWGLMWWGAFPGPKNGFDEMVGLAIFAATFPMAGWFFLRSLGSISNSIAGADGEGRPVAWVPAWIIPLLPYASLIIAAAGAILLGQHGYAWYVVASPLISGLLSAAAIFLGERRRGTNAESSPVASDGPPADDAEDPHAAGRLLARIASIAAAVLLLALVGDAVFVIHAISLLLVALAFALMFVALPNAL
jgi:hypothetical protein